MSTLVATRLQHVHPAPHALVEGGAAEFYWIGPAKTSYVFQIANDPLCYDVVFEAEVANTSLLTVFEALPEDGDEYFWRVRPLNEEDAWTEATPFIATDQDHIVAAHLRESKALRHAALAAGQPGTTGDNAAANTDFAYGTTSFAMALGTVLFMFGTFGTLIATIASIMT
ncbi:MAG: hypothetical protein AAGJ10_10040 [Bacteroidota bacterium]